MLPLDQFGSETYNQEEGASCMYWLREKEWDLFSTYWCLFWTCQFCWIAINWIRLKFRELMLNNNESTSKFLQAKHRNTSPMWNGEEDTITLPNADCFCAQISSYCGSFKMFFFFWHDGLNSNTQLEELQLAPSSKIRTRRAAGDGGGGVLARHHLIFGSIVLVVFCDHTPNYTSRKRVRYLCRGSFR